MTTLQLAIVSPDLAEGIYGDAKNALPDRMRFLNPAAAASVAQMAKDGKKPRVSDMLRSAESSLRARSEKRGVQPPAYSAHNFGLAMDLDVGALLKRWKVDKEGLDKLLDEYGWVCHRSDHELESESWHYNFLGDPKTPEGMEHREPVGRTSAPAVEKRILELYGKTFLLNETDVQTALQGLGMYSGELDGKLGPLSREALRVFQRAWDLNPTGIADDRTERTLAFVTARRQVLAIPPG